MRRRSPSSATRWCSATPSTSSFVPATSTSHEWAACTSSWPGGGRSSPTRAAFRCSRWAMDRWPTRSRAGAGSARAASCRSTRRVFASSPMPTAAPSSWAPRPRWRCRPRSARTSRSRSTSALPSTWIATTRRARPHARTAGSTAASTGSESTRRTANCCSGSCRAVCTRTCGSSRPSASRRRTWAAWPWAGPSGRRRLRCARWWRGRCARCATSSRATCSASATSTTSSTRWRPGSTPSTAPRPPASAAMAPRLCRIPTRAGGST